MVCESEVTVIFMDTSQWMCHNRSHRFLEQVDAIELYCKKKLQSDPDNHVGIFATGQSGFGIVVEPTQDLSKIMNGVRDFTLVGGHTDLEYAINLAPFRCFHLEKEHKNKNLLKRIVVFAGGPVPEHNSDAMQLGTDLYGSGIALDVVSFGTQQGQKRRILDTLVDLANTGLQSSGLMWEKVELLTEEENKMMMMIIGICKGRKQDGTGHDEGTKRYRDRGDECGQKQDYRGHDEGREIYRDRGDECGQKQDYRGHDEGREIHRDRGGRYGRKRDYRGNDDTRDRKRKHDDKGPDEGRETYRDRSDRYLDWMLENHYISE